MFEAKCTWDFDVDRKLAQADDKIMADNMKNRIDKDLMDQYNGDDGPGFDYEFHQSLLEGVHLMNDDERLAWFAGWNAAKEFFGVEK